MYAVDRRLISPQRKRIRTSGLFLIDWLNYLYTWCKFYVVKIVGSKEQKLTFWQLGKIESYNILVIDTYSYFEFVKIMVCRKFSISGIVGNLQDRWNIWTFGIKVYHIHVEKPNDTQNFSFIVVIISIHSIIRGRNCLSVAYLNYWNQVSIGSGTYQNKLEDPYNIPYNPQHITCSSYQTKFAQREKLREMEWRVMRYLLLKIRFYRPAFFDEQSSLTCCTGSRHDPHVNHSNTYVDHQYNQCDGRGIQTRTSKQMEKIYRNNASIVDTVQRTRMLIGGDTEIVASWSGQLSGGDVAGSAAPARLDRSDKCHLNMPFVNVGRCGSGRWLVYTRTVTYDLEYYIKLTVGWCVGCWAISLCVCPVAKSTYVAGLYRICGTMSRGYSVQESHSHPSLPGRLISKRTLSRRQCPGDVAPILDTWMNNDSPDSSGLSRSGGVLHTPKAITKLRRSGPGHAVFGARFWVELISSKGMGTKYDKECSRPWGLIPISDKGTALKWYTEFLKHTEINAKEVLGHKVGLHNGHVTKSGILSETDRQLPFLTQGAMGRGESCMGLLDAHLKHVK